MKYLAAALVALAACGGEYIDFPLGDKDLTNYSVSPNAVTPNGVPVDTGTYHVNLNSLGERIEKIRDCLLETKKRVPWGDPGLQHCSFESLGQRLTIKIVRLYYSQCSNWQFVGYNENSGPLLADPAGCLAKGKKPSDKCPCAWRSMVQGGVVITPPPVSRSQEELPLPKEHVKKAPYLWDAARVLTGCSSMIWHSPYAKCLTY